MMLKLRPLHYCFLLLLLLTLGLFFGLFFGLNYPEIVRHGWPRTSCTVLSSEIVTRYCCESSCNNGCSNAPSGSQQCSSLISQLDNGYSPSACAANSSTCPPGVGGACDGGYYCCSTCCSTCSSCTTSCSGHPQTCKTSCSSYSCNCYCCSQTSHRYCTLSCPICYNVELDVRYKTRSGAVENTTYTQEFKHDNNSASVFFAQHRVNSTSPCHYNPHDFSQILFNISFTAWKWAVTAIFGILPLAATLSFFASILLIIPALRLVQAGYRDASKMMKGWNNNRAAKTTNKERENYTTDEDGIAPPPYASADVEIK